MIYNSYLFSFILLQNNIFGANPNFQSFNFNNEDFGKIGSAFLIFFLCGLIIIQKLGTTLEKNFFNILENISIPIEIPFLGGLSNDDNNFSDSLSDFLGLDETTIQVSKDIKTKFSDIAGNEEAKVELKEVVKFLKSSKDFVEFGASVPRGVLLAGPPGTGKTLFARAIAGESKTTFLKVSGSQFVELLVGVGANRVRELFEKARTLKPSIIFIDEIDSIARARSGNTSIGGNDEREQTLNQILTEMDGFKADDDIVVIGATNRIDILDPAIKRPGRFDRQIIINLPNLKDRIEILKIHSANKALEPGLSLSQIAFRTIGFSGADLANLLNEAAILAARFRKPYITMKEINISMDRIAIGLAGRQLIRVKARQLAAFHEMGHAVIGTLSAKSEKIEKLTLVPRGETLGTTSTLPSISQYNSRKIFFERILITLSGRATEEIINGTSELTLGADEDFDQMTQILRIMVLQYAMSRLQQLKQEAQIRNLYLIGSDAKMEISNLIDNFTTSFLDTTYNEILNTISLMRSTGERIVDELLALEEISGKQLRVILGESLSTLNPNEIMYYNRQSKVSSAIEPDYKKTLTEFDENLNEHTETEDNNIDERNDNDIDNFTFSKKKNIIAPIIDIEADIIDQAKVKNEIKIIEEVSMKMMKDN